MKSIRKAALCVMLPLMLGATAAHAGEVMPFSEHSYETMAMEKMPMEQRKQALEMKKKIMQMEMKHDKEMLEMRTKLLDLYLSYIN